MSKKQVKGGKKRKGGKQKGPQVLAFDLEFINKADLKKYVTMLEKEFSSMRKDCAFYSSNKEKIIEFLETRRNLAMSQDRLSFVNNSVKDDLIEQMRRYPEKYDKRTLLKDREKVEKKLKDAFDDFLVRSTAKANHFDVEHFVKEQIADKDKHLESDQFMSKLMAMDLRETCNIAQEDVNAKYNEKFESVLRQNFDGCLKANQDFNSAKTRMLISIWGGQDHRRGGDSCVDDIKRMQDFFYEISSSNSEVIKMLRKKLASSLMEIKKINFNLKRVKLQNVDLQSEKASGYFPVSPDRPSFRFPRNMESAKAEKIFENLKLRHEVLRQQLRKANETLLCMKNQFICATRKIHQKADFKALLLEEMIKLNIQMESVEPEGEKLFMSNKRPSERDRVSK